MKIQSFRRFWVIAVLLLLALSIPGQLFAMTVQNPRSTEFSTFSNSFAAEEAEQPVGVVSTGALNVRSGPGVNFGRVTVIYNGQVVSLLGRWASNNWVKVRLYSGVEGWVNSTYLTTSVPVSQLPVLGGEPPTVKPTPPESQLTAVVATGALNVRSGPAISFSSVAVVVSGEQLVLLGRNVNTSWVKVRTPGNVEGWVNASLIATTVVLSSLPVVDSPPASPAATVKVSAANVRSGPGGQYDVIAILYQGQTVALIGRNNSASWLKVRLGNGQEGWMLTSAVQANVPVQNLPVVETSAPSNAAVVNVSWLNVRYGPGTSFGVFTVLHRGQVVSMIGRAANSTWVQVRLPSGSTGWVNSNYLLGGTPITELPVTWS